MKKMYKKISLWEDSVSLRHHPRLEGVADCEVLVLGGGMAGILIASKLAEEGIDVAVVDAGRIGHGVTAGTTAKITSQHGLIYQKLVNDIGLENAGLYLEANEAAIQEYARICEAGEETCGFHRTANYIYSLRGQKVLEAEMAALEQIGCKSARFRSGTSLTLPFENDGAVEFPLQAGFHPLKFLKKITESDHLKNTDFFENSRITALKRWQDGGWEAVSEHGSILADQVVIASHFPFIDRRGMYFIKMHQNRSLVIAGTVKADESEK